MNFVQLLNLLSKFPLVALLNYPRDLSDSAAVRVWVRTVLESLEIFAQLTKTQLDDDAIKILNSIVASDTTWNLVFTVLYNVFSGEDDSSNIEIDLIANKVGVSPVLIITIIQAIVALLKILRNRRS